jgi:uncharacterized LabA/DUF88 family protein
MSSPIDQASEPQADAEQNSSIAAGPRVRRFAPKRSRSAAISTAPQVESLVSDSSTTTSPPAKETANVLESMPIATSQPAEDAPQSGVPGPSSAARRPSRSRRSAGSPVPAARSAETSEHGASDPTDTQIATNGVIATSNDAESGAPSSSVTSAEVGGVETSPVSRTTRRRSARQSPPITTESAPLAGAQPLSGDAQSIVEAQANETLADSNAAGIPEVLDSAVQPPVAEPTRRTTRPSRSRRPSRSAPKVTEQSATVAPPIPLVDEAPDEDPRRDPYDGWRIEGDMHESAPGGDLDSAEVLARALLEMFPAVKVEPNNGESAGASEIDTSTAEDLVSGAQLPVAERDDAEGESADESSRRRGRRGRRGGRGRRRGVPLAQSGVGEEPDAESLAAAELAPAAESVIPAVESPLPAALPELSDLQFSPGPRLQPERSWRDRGPQRRWNRTFPRDTQPVVMPPPKPSNGARFAAIPQAIAPRPQISMPDASTRSVTQFLMPDLRINEPLAPGESRTERLLDVQNRLLQALLEGQAQQIDVLTATVSGLKAAIDNISSSVGSQAFQPRTGIFVDAPNVCYAAENARVTLDFGRMLKYLTRGRHLVHALSYSPIIDDVREGIRYETQRFVAPFLRTGYKLITKPLKRFSDGSAKGNFDIELALDIITMADRLDVVVLVSGDSDFESVIQHIQSRGVRVEVVAFASNVSTELVNVADTFLDIGQHLEHFKAE